MTRRRTLWWKAITPVPRSTSSRFTLRWECRKSGASPNVRFASGCSKEMFITNHLSAAPSRSFRRKRSTSFWRGGWPKGKGRRRGHFVNGGGEIVRNLPDTPQQKTRLIYEAACSKTPVCNFAGCLVLLFSNLSGSGQLVQKRS